MAENYYQVMEDFELEFQMGDNSDEEELGREINMFLKMEQEFYKLLDLPPPQKNMAIPRWCRMAEKIFKKWHLDVHTVFILLDIPAFSDWANREMERAQNVENLNDTSTLSLIREVVTSYTQAEVLLQLSYEFSQLHDSEDFISAYDNFFKKCRTITDIWGLTESVSYSVLSKMFNIF